MKKLVYKTLGEMLVAGPHGTMTPLPISATTELPYSEENLLHAQAVAQGGTVEVIETADPETPAPAVAVQRQLVLEDRATGKHWELYVENGKLMMEVL